ncbi:MAG: phage portal protein family [Clostridiaceae bacterium]|nr:phage portal protein family [Clostridiaceae bacterium]
MSLITWLVNRISGTTEPTEVEIKEFFNLQAEVVIRNLAFQTAVNLIANAISKCEFKTFYKNEEVKKQEYYLWNIEPNKNQNSSEFIHKWISKLYEENECLIIETNGQLLVADTFSKKEYALFDCQFTGVTVNGFTFNKTFLMNEVMYFKLNNNDIRKLINGMYESYGKLISYSMNAYQRSRGTKGIFKYETLPVTGTDDRKAFDALINEKISKWLAGDNAALPLGRGQEWKELTQKTYASDSTRDIKAMVDDIYDFTARAICIPSVMLKGDTASLGDEVVNNLLTFCVDPLTDMLQEEINRKRSGYAGFSQGTYLDIDTKCIKHIDLLSVSTAIDKLISSGAFSINDIRKLVNENEIDEDYANQHFITKNYASVEDLIASFNSGGDGNG